MMKSIHLLFIFLLFLGCSKKDESVETETSNTTQSKINSESETTQNQVAQNDLKRSESSLIIKDNSEVLSQWGLEFKMDVISLETDHSVRNLSKAISMIININETSATGFFVSSDGLFLTNYHVINDTFCSSKVCRGFKIVRDFSHGGDLEVFEEFEIVALNKELDYTLLKVKIDKPVDFLELNQEASKAREDQEFKILGHPFGAPMRMSDALLEAGGQKMRAIAINGNSGSPVINLHSKKVMGLYKLGLWEKDSLNKQGMVDHYSYMSDSEAILNNLKVIYPDLDMSSENGLTLNGFQESLKKDNQVSNDTLSFDRIIHQHILDKAVFNDKLNKLLGELLKKQMEATTTTHLEPLISFLNTMSSINLTSPSSDKLINQEKTQMIEQILNVNYNAKELALNSFLVSQDKKTRESCIVAYDKKEMNLLEFLYVKTHYCLTELNGDELNEAMNTLEAQEKNYKILSLILKKNIFLTRNLNQEIRELSIQILKELAQKSENMQTSYLNESLILLLENDETSYEKVILNWSL